MAPRRPGKRMQTPDGVRVFGKNANREGSVYRQADGRWCATWWVPGERRPRKATGKTRQEAVERRTRRRKQAGLDGTELRTVGELAEWWLQNVHKHAVRPSSWGKSQDRVRRIKATLGTVLVTELDYRAVTEWQAKLGETLLPRTVRHHRQTLAQVVDEAVKMGMLVGNPVRSVKPPALGEVRAVALDLDEVRALLAVARDHRLGAAVALLFLQGWRVSEVLGLAWEDVDLEAGTARVRRASVYVDGVGQVLGPTKTAEARGEHWLMPTVVELLAERQEMQAVERAAGPVWEQVRYDGEVIDLVFTTPMGGLVLRQSVAKVVKQAAKTAGVSFGVSTHTGRRSVVTSLFVDGGEALEDIARFVGHAKSSTTAGYVRRLGQRPKVVADRAAALLDGAAAERSTERAEGSESPAEAGSNRGSNGPESGPTAEDPGGT